MLLDLFLRTGERGWSRVLLSSASWVLVVLSVSQKAKLLKDMHDQMDEHEVEFKKLDIGDCLVWLLASNCAQILS